MALHRLRNFKLYKRILLAITGASGSIYAERLLEILLTKHPEIRVYLVCTDTAVKVIHYELKDSLGDFSLRQILAAKGKGYEQLTLFRNDDFFTPLASGSSAPTDMVVLPCSMGTLARIRGGLSSNLLERCADVMLKQKGRLVICPRESPFNQIHLENMLDLCKMGVQLVPLMPGFYFRPTCLSDIVDFQVGKILETLEMTHDLYKPWAHRLM